MLIASRNFYNTYLKLLDSALVCVRVHVVCVCVRVGERGREQNKLIVPCCFFILYFQGPEEPRRNKTKTVCSVQKETSRGQVQ